jgi:ethanolaminephosphotransferase
MSTTASNYDVSKLFLGTFLAFVSFALAYFSSNKMKHFSSSGIFYMITLFLYGISMFASSYVEEEHNFWYLMASTWLLYLLITESVAPVSESVGC